MGTHKNIGLTHSYIFTIDFNGFVTFIGYVNFNSKALEASTVVNCFNSKAYQCDAFVTKIKTIDAHKAEITGVDNCFS